MEPCDGFKWKLILFTCICILTSLIEADIRRPRMVFSDQVLSARQKLDEVLNSHSSGQIKMDIKIYLETTFLFPKPNDTYNIATGLINIESAGDHTLAIYRSKADSLQIWSIKQTKLSLLATVDLSFLQPQQITFTKIFDWNGQFFILLCFQDKCSVYTVNLDSTVMFRMSISSSSDLPVDAHFFVQCQNLYILMLFQIDRRTSHTRIYQWDKTSLDEVKTSQIVSSATSIILFTQADNLIIVMLSPKETHIEYPSQVWLRRPSGETNRVQCLPITKPESISHFTYRGEHFIIILQQNQDKSVYWWAGAEFVRWKVNFEGHVKSTQVFALHSQGGSDSLHHNQTFLLFKTATSLDVCIMAADRIQKVSELALSNEYSVSSVAMEVVNETTYFLIKSDGAYNSNVTIYNVNYNWESPFDEHDRTLSINSVQSRLDEVSHSISELEDKFQDLKLILPTLLYVNKPATLNHTTITVSGITHIESGEIQILINKNFEIGTKMQNILQKIPNIQNEVNLSWQKLEDISETQTRELEFKEAVNFNVANINSLSAVSINNDVFKPESYLYSTPPDNNISQRLKKLKAKELEVTWLVTSSIGNSSVKDFIIENSVIEVPVRVVNLTVNNIEMENMAKINHIAGDLKKGKSNLQLPDNSIIDNLNIEEIDNINVVQLFNSLVIQSSKNRSTVYGNVHFEKGFHAKKLSYPKPKSWFGNQTSSFLPITLDSEGFQDYPIPNIINSYRVFRRDAHEGTNTIRLRKVKVIGDLKVDRIVFKNSFLSSRSNRFPTSNLDQIRLSRTNLKPKNIAVRHLVVDFINGEDVRHLLSMSDLINSDLHLSTENLTVQGNLDSDLINSIDVNKKFDETVFVDEDFYLRNATFEHVTANNIKVDNLQEVRTEQVIQLGNENGQLNFTGSLHFPNALKVEMINDENVDFDKVVNKHIPTIIRGRKIFSAQVSIQLNMSVSTINSKAVEDLSQNILRTSTDQELRGFFSFKKASISSISDVTVINGIDTSKLLYTDERKLNFSNDIKFSSLNVAGNITATMLFDSCQLPKVVEDQIQFSNKRTWDTLVVKGDSFWPYTKFGQLQMLLDSAVTNSSDQEISGNIYISQLFTDRLTSQYINEQNITLIFHDSLMKSKEKQVISGRKIFKDSLNCQNMTVKGNIILGSIVGINQSIVDIDRKLVRHIDQENASYKIVTGHKTFLKGFTAFNLQSSGGINNIKAEHIVKSLTEEDTMLPPLVVKSLHVDNNLQANKINDLSINSFLGDCIYINSSNIQEFTKRLHISGSIILEGRTTTPKINNVFVNDLVFITTAKSPVWIKGCKRFKNNVHVETNVQIENLNGKKFYDTYKRSWKKYQNVTVNGTLEILSDVDINTIFAQEFFVGNKKLIHISNKTASP